ncbi:2Fe-2S iron-sulfur cluster-binding protein [Streptomyces sp. NPDC048193]
MHSKEQSAGCGAGVCLQCRVRVVSGWSRSSPRP